MYIPMNDPMILPMENSMRFTSLVTVVSVIPRVTTVGISQYITIFGELVNSPMFVEVKALQMPNCWLDVPAKLPCFSHEIPRFSHQILYENPIKLVKCPGTIASSPASSSAWWVSGWP